MSRRRFAGLFSAGAVGAWSSSVAGQGGGSRGSTPLLPLRANPKTLPPPVGFSHLSEADGRIIFISGQVPRNPEGKLVGAGDFVAQLEQVFHNLSTAVREAGGEFKDVVKLNYYCNASVDRGLLGNVSRVRDKFVDLARPPASTFVFVAGLARPEWLIEIEAVLAIQRLADR